MSHLLDARCLLSGIASGDFTDVCEDIALEETALGTCVGDALLEEERADGWVERVTAWGLGEGWGKACIDRMLALQVVRVVRTQSKRMNIRFVMGLTGVWRRRRPRGTCFIVKRAAIAVTEKGHCQRRAFTKWRLIVNMLDIYAANWLFCS